MWLYGGIQGFYGCSSGVIYFQITGESVRSGGAVLQGEIGTMGSYKGEFKASI